MIYVHVIINKFNTKINIIIVFVINFVMFFN